MYAVLILLGSILGSGSLKLALETVGLVTEDVVGLTTLFMAPLASFAARCHGREQPGKSGNCGNSERTSEREHHRDPLNAMSGKAGRGISVASSFAPVAYSGA